MAKWRIYNEDVREWAKSYSRKKFHAMLCDPPYHLTSITKRFGRKNSAEVKVKEFFDENGNSKGSSPYKRTSSGFMGQTWDGGDIAFDPETWEALGEHLYPGAFGMAFSASRNWHRLAVAIEDAGFVLHPSVFCWAQGQGFPKATRIKGHKEFDGHRYGLQALKPSVEPIIVFQKPYDGRPLDNIIQTGAGVLNIDGGRIGVGELVPGGGNGKASHGGRYGSGETSGMRPKVEPHLDGRWPSNLILSDDEAAAALDRQSGDIKAVQSRRGNGIGVGYHGSDKEYDTVRGYDDSGSASRFFFRVREQLDEADPVRYQAKASRSERDAGLEGMDAKRVARGSSNNLKQWEAGARDFDDLDEKSKAFATSCRNTHPTVKPLALAKYLATLLLPPVEYAPRRILIPFSGVGSEMIGAGLAGWEQIVGVEFDTENNYVDIANARLEHWLKL